MHPNAPFQQKEVVLHPTRKLRQTIVKNQRHLRQRRWKKGKGYRLLSLVVVICLASGGGVRFGLHLPTKCCGKFSKVNGRGKKGNRIGNFEKSEILTENIPGAGGFFSFFRL